MQNRYLLYDIRYSSEVSPLRHQQQQYARLFHTFYRRIVLSSEHLVFLVGKCI